MMTISDKILLALGVFIVTPIAVALVFLLGALVYAQATAPEGDCPHSGFCPDCPTWEEVEL